MPATVLHALSMTTPDDPAYENQPKHWNSGHSVSLSVAASEISALFSNVNGVTFGLAGTNITGSVVTTYQPAGAYLTTAMASNRGSDFVQANAVFAGTSASGTIASNGISISIGPYITTAMASNRGSDFVQANATIAGTSISGTIASNGFSLSVGPYITTAALSNHSHGNPTLALTNISGTTASASNGLTISLAAGNYITTARASNDAIGLNTAQTNVTWTVNSSGLSLNAGGYAGTSTGMTGGTVTLNSSGIAISLPAYLTTAMASNRGSDFVQATAAFAGTNASGTIASNGISVSVAASVAPGSYWRNAAAELLAQTQTTSVGGSTSYIQPVAIDLPLSASYLRLLHSFAATNTTSIATTANATGSGRIFSTLFAVLYVQNTGASSMSLRSFASGSVGMTQAWSLSANSTGSQWTLSQSITHPITGNTSGFTTGVTTSLTNYSLGSLSLTRFTGLQHLDIPFNVNIPASNYWLMTGQSSSSAAGGSGANFTQLRLSNSCIVASQINSNVPAMGQVANASSQWLFGLGSFTTNAINTTASLDFSNISSMASNPLMALQIMRFA